MQREIDWSLGRARPLGQTAFHCSKRMRCHQFLLGLAVGNLRCGGCVRGAVGCASLSLPTGRICRRSRTSFSIDLKTGCRRPSQSCQASKRDARSQTSRAPNLKAKSCAISSTETRSNSKKLGCLSHDHCLIGIAEGGADWGSAACG